MGGLKKSFIFQFITTALITIVTAGVSLLAVLSFQSAGPTQPATCIADHCFCEQPTLSGLVLPINAVASLAFVFLGVWGLFSGSRFNKKTRERNLILIMALTMVVIGISGFFYHGTMSYLGQFFEVVSMYMFALLLSSSALVRRGQLKLVAGIFVFIAAIAVFATIQYYIPEIRRVLFGILLIPGIILAQQPRTTGHAWFSRPTRFFYMGAAFMTFAYAFWIFDNSPLCMPNSLFQGHAVWLILTAIGMYMMILHYKATAHKLKNSVKK